MREAVIRTENTAMFNRVRTCRLAAIFLASVLVTSWLGCKQEAASTPARPIPEVPVVTVSSQTMPDEPEFIGQTEASRPVEIRSQVTGILKERFFTEGRDVKQGDRLYQIDPIPFKAAKSSANAKVAQAEARLVQAKQNLARVTPLLAEQAVSQKDVDDAVAEELAAKAALEGAKGDQIKAKFDLDNTLITAPISGRIERSRLYEGRLISAQTDLLTTIHQLDPMYVIASAPEMFVLKRLRERASNRIQGATLYELRGVITFSDGSTYSHEGKFDLLEVGVRSATGTRDFRVTFPNPNSVLFPGQFVKVRILGAVRTGVILLPQSAVQHGPKGPIVFVVGADNKVEIRPVRATSWRGNQWSIEDGLHEGDQVIIAGFHMIAPGAPVKTVPYNQSDPAASGQPTDAKSEQAK
ncbi:MAG TPA: efflux RND transporter periplasmic adaptor subunit [Nitrospiraceae bacterium]|nr:efflux RND transporter periplasmic adaptor subunit [Nitrospiraceae bacterium]